MPTPLIDSAAFQAGVWATAPIVESQFDPSIAVVLDEQFVNFDSTDTYTVTQATSGTAAISTTVPGALLLDAGATTDNQGVNVQRLKTGFVPAANKSIWAEFAVTLTATTPPVTKAQIFIGLAATDTTIIASGAVSVNNRIGWLIGDGGLLVSSFSVDKAGVPSTTTGHTFVAATKVRLGFLYSGVDDTVQQYINGVATGSPVATTYIPKLVVYPSFVCQSDATDRPNLIISGYKIIQLR